MLSLTENAIDYLKNSIDPGDFVRVGVKSGGCSGLSYHIGIEEGYDEDSDILFEFDELKICVDKKSAFLLSATVLDYVESLSSSGFKFDNPGASRTCGCGESFSC